MVERKHKNKKVFIANNLKAFNISQIDKGEYMGTQLTIDFSRPAKFADSGKRTKRITFTASEDLKEFLNIVSLKSGETISELCQRYVIEGIKSDISNMLFTQANENRTLANFLRK